MAKASAVFGLSVLYIWLYTMELTTVAGDKVLCLPNKKIPSCSNKIIQCPSECPQRKPAGSNAKACFVDCGPKCEAVCKNRVPTCNGFGSICYDPRFVGGDGVMFYFHGSKAQTYSILYDLPTLAINAHLIGTRPRGRPRDYTWIDSIAILIPSHTFIISAKKASLWDDAIDHLSFSVDNNTVTVEETHVAEWSSPDGSLRIERTNTTNSAIIYVEGMAEINLIARPITETDNRVHNYQLPVYDCFVHLDMQFKFFNLSGNVEGVLGQTYRPGYVSPVQRGVPMPVMGGEDKYRTSSLLSTDCVACHAFGLLEKQSTLHTREEPLAKW